MLMTFRQSVNNIMWQILCSASAKYLQLFIIYLRINQGFVCNALLSTLLSCTLAPRAHTTTDWATACPYICTCMHSHMHTQSRMLACRCMQTNTCASHANNHTALVAGGILQLVGINNLWEEGAHWSVKDPAVSYWSVTGQLLVSYWSVTGQ